jgi:mycothiol synthase
MSSSRLRPLRTEDAEQVAALFAETFGAARRLDAEDIRAWLRNDALKPEWLRVLEVEGSLVGYGDIWIDDVVELDVAAPGHWEVFFDWAESEAREHGVQRVRVHFSPGHELEERVAERGYAYWRSSYTMEIDVVDPRPAQLPPGLELRTFRDGVDDEKLRAMLNDAFAEGPLWHHVSPSNFREFYLRARGYDPSLWFLAWEDDLLAGFAIAFPERGGDEELGWVATLGVGQAWRRRGLGEALLRTAFQALHARGLRRVGLGVDAENATGALRLYERAGMRKIRQADIWELEL